MADLSPINFVTGTLGAGKSYLANRYVFKYLVAGKIVATNYDLVGDWPKTVQDIQFGGLGYKISTFGMSDYELRQEKMRRFAVRQKIRGRAWRFDVQDDLYDYRLPGEGEDRGLLVLDEAALQMNTRNWEDRKKREVATYGNAMKSLQFYINMRKLGWSCMVISHSHEQLDSQVRMMGGSIIRCRNLSKVTIPFTSVRMFKKPRFVAIHIWPETKPAHIYKREAYGLDMRIAQHYRSMEEFDANPKKLGMRLQLPPYQPQAIYIPQPKWTHDGGAARKRHRERMQERFGSKTPTDTGDGGYTGSPGSWRTAS